MLKLKLQYFGHLLWRAHWLESTLMLGKIEGKRGRGWQSTRWLDSFTNWTSINLSKLCEIVKDREAWHAAVHVVTKRWTQLSNWTTINVFKSGALPQEAYVSFFFLNSDKDSERRFFAPLLFGHFYSPLTIKKPNCRNEVTKELKLTLDLCSLESTHLTCCVASFLG